MVEAQEESPRKQKERREKELKRKSKREKSARIRGDLASGEQDPKQDRCVLCNGIHSAQKFKFLTRCQQIIKDSGKTREQDCFAMFTAEKEMPSEEDGDIESLFSTLHVEIDLQTHQDLGFAT